MIQTALILEDILEVNAWMKQMLLETFAGIRIQQVYSVKEAKQALLSQHYDLALIDLSLPDGKGTEVIDWLAQHSANTLSVVVTIFEDDQYLFEAICHGAKGYLLKDLEPTLFQQHLKNLIAGIHAFSEAARNTRFKGRVDFSIIVTVAKSNGCKYIRWV